MGVSVRIDIDVRPVYAMLTELEREQAPFAISDGLNSLAKEIQAALRKQLQQRMRIRRDWVPRYGVKIPKFAKKRDDPMTVEIQVPVTHDFLWKFEPGETKRPRGKDLAIPSSRYFSRAAVIPNDMRPRALALEEHETKTGKIQVKGRNRTFVIDKGPVPGIYQRVGRGRGDIRLLYAFKGSAPTPRLFDFHGTARTIYRERWESILGVAFRKAVATARRR